MDTKLFKLADEFSITALLAAKCRYGENAWQSPAGLYTMCSSDPLALDNFKVVAGADPSYNNYVDLDRLLQTATHIAAVMGKNCGAVGSIAIAVKHGNPCGAAYGIGQIPILQKAVRGDTRAIFGGLVLTNFPIGEVEAEELLTHASPPRIRRLLDGIIAPEFSDQAIKMLTRKGDKCRFIANPSLANLSAKSLHTAPRFRYVRGGVLFQPNYTFVMDRADPRLARYGDIPDELIGDLLLAWAIGSTSNSNTITLVKDGMLIGNGVGQQDRVGCCELTLKRAVDAGHTAKGAVAYSDSFFPFPDGPEVLAEAGISAIVTSSGSQNDAQTRAVCHDYGIGLLMIPDAVGRGFFGH